MTLMPHSAPRLHWGPCSLQASSRVILFRPPRVPCLLSGAPLSWSHFAPTGNMRPGRRHSPSVWTRMAEAEMSVVMVKYGIHRSCEGTGLRRTNPGYQPLILRAQGIQTQAGGDCELSAGAPRAVPGRGGGHLDLPVLEDARDAAVEASPREHGSDGVGQVQHGLHHRHHVLVGHTGHM